MLLLKGKECGIGFYLTLVLNDRPFVNALAVSFFRRCARLRLCAYDFHCSIQKRRGKLWRNVSFNESHVLYCVSVDLQLLIWKWIKHRRYRPWCLVFKFLSGLNVLQKGGNTFLYRIFFSIRSKNIFLDTFLKCIEMLFLSANAVYKESRIAKSELLWAPSFKAHLERLFCTREWKECQVSTTHENHERERKKPLFPVLSWYKILNWNF